MKKNLLVLPLCAVIGTALALSGHSLVGSWKAAYGNGVGGRVVFRNNGTLLATFNGQTWKVGGQYKVNGSNLSISDSTCGFNYWGRYKMNWYSNDSVNVVVVEDTCTGRRMNADGSVLVRLKK
ncbi:MAG TPA: hypothetical protein VN616_05020 [Puia sp.]|nr:hypothetical protein [Puia sp.]